MRRRNHGRGQGSIENRRFACSNEISTYNVSQLPVKQQLQSGSLRVLTELRTYSWYSMPIALALATLLLARMQVNEEM